MSSRVPPGPIRSLARDAERLDDRVSFEVPVIQRLPVAEGAYSARAATLVVEVSNQDGDTWVYLGDGEQQMIEVSAESIRRLGSVLVRAFPSVDGEQD